jgi:phage I-like protein
MAPMPELCRVDGRARQWVHILAPGLNEARDGRRFLLSHPEAVVADFEARRIDLPVDYHHQHDHRAPGQVGPIPAAGWIKALRHDARGLWGQVEWTAKAAGMLRDREFRYLSPVILAQPDGTVLRIKGAALVHDPALHLTALASQEPDMDRPAPDAPNSTATVPLADLIAALDLDTAATAEDAMNAILALGKAGSAPDPRHYAPVEAMAELMRAHHAGRTELAEDRTRAKVEDAVREGRITPAMRGWATQLCAVDPASFDAFLATTGAPFAHLSTVTHTAAEHPSRKGGGQVDADAATLAAQLGIDPARLRG